MGSIIQMYASANPANAMVSIDVPQDGVLEGVSWACAPAASGADVSISLQLGFSASMVNSNDARGVISNCCLYHDITTSGDAETSWNYYDKLPDIPIAAGERLYLNGTGTGVTTTVYLTLHFSFNEPRPSRRRS